VKIGERYQAVIPAHSLPISKDESVEFDEVVKHVEVLPKPRSVLVWDGDTEVEESLPVHLQHELWHLVRDINTNARFWLNAEAYNITELQ
jgi:hypothetical protein